MYLRRVRFSDGYHYIIRESYMDAECWKSRDLIDLGPNPASYIVHAGGNGFYFSDELDECLKERGVAYGTEELETLFLPFLPRDIRRVIEAFQTHRKHTVKRYSACVAEMLERQRQLHPFDKRRVYYLRSGIVNIGNPDKRWNRCFNFLYDKSRDEIEHSIEEMERGIKAREVRSYLYTALNLESAFPENILRYHPEALNSEYLDECFETAVCNLNRDESFFAGVDGHDDRNLHPYLVKYVILYFDADLGPSRWSENIREFLHQRGFRLGLPRKSGMSVSEAARILGISEYELRDAKVGDLAKRYRKKAKETHPDRGGDKESFIRLRDAFECLVQLQRKQ